MITRKKINGFTWLDVGDPTEDEKKEICETYKLTVESINDLLNARSIPFGTQVNDRLLVLLRFADDQTFREETADTVEELTHRLAIIYGGDFILTIHRHKRVPYNYDVELNDPAMEPKEKLFLYILSTALKSFDPALTFGDDLFEELELSVLENRTLKTTIQSIYFLKRKAAVYRRILGQLVDILVWYLGERNFADRKKMKIQRLIAETQKHKAMADELLEDTNHLLQSYVAISSHQTNEIMRVLTIFSVFFMPLTFIVGVYGMNFKWMPEINWRYGYPATWGVMLSTCVILFYWFRSKGWIFQSHRKSALP